MPQQFIHECVRATTQELPAVVISLLGFHRSTEDDWTRESQGFGTLSLIDTARP
ncbi:hypothetical protein ACGFY9_17025 [Streptomyces sp. NPDC048504]|uniref:hypothetical protein n=1 Tax=Streptomyces sp. NPDC048504 TaxID=3365559 RepID=UPI0037123EC3